MTHDLTTRLSAFATAPATPTSAARHVARMSALDWLAVGLAGAQEPVAGIVRDMALADGGAAQASVFGASDRLPARAAALVNGTTSHALDYDDTHFAHIGHPSVAVFPAALAMGEHHDAPLDRVLEAALIGMELSVRVGLWLGRTHYQTGFHQTATAGAFGAAAAAGRLTGLTAEQMEHGLGLAATRAAGLKTQFGTMGKPYNAGLAATTGVECALLVAAGFRANPGAMEGAFGFGATHHGEGLIDAALDGLGETWLFEQVSHKFHACCHGLHAALEAARMLDMAAPEIAEMKVTTHPRWMSVCNQSEPATGLGAKFSYKTVLAMSALGYDTAQLNSFSEDTCADPRLQELRHRITVSSDDALSETAARLDVLRRDGETLTATHDLQAPMTLADREVRVRDKAKALIGADRANSLWHLLQASAKADDLAAMIRG
ncbi:MmgE/PrpD family protein [Arenibacterium sp. CAU 1754]